MLRKTTPSNIRFESENYLKKVMMVRPLLGQASVGGQTTRQVLPACEKLQHRADRIIQRRPGLIKEAAMKALAHEPLSEDEFVLTHKGFLTDEWTEEMEAEWSAILRREWEDWTE